VDATVNIHNQLTALLCFGTYPRIDSSNYTINSIWLSEQQAAQMCNFGRKHRRYLIATQYETREGTSARHNSLHFLQQSLQKITLNKGKFDFWTYTTRHVGRSG